MVQAIPFQIWHPLDHVQTSTRKCPARLPRERQGSETQCVPQTYDAIYRAKAPIVYTPSQSFESQIATAKRRSWPLLSKSVTQSSKGLLSSQLNHVVSSAATSGCRPLNTIAPIESNFTT